MPFVAKGRPLRPGEFYIPRLGELGVPQYVPRSIGRFIALFRALFDTEIYVPKCLDVNALKDLADYIHILVRTWATDEWTFERFAPACAACTGMDLTGAMAGDARLARYGLQLDERLARLVRQETPFYGSTQAPNRGLTVYGLFVPMSDTGQTITHCLIMTAYQGGKQHGDGQGTADLG